METTPSAAWLARAALIDPDLRRAWTDRLATVCHPEAPAGTPLLSAVQELKSGLRSLLGLVPVSQPASTSGLVLSLGGPGGPESFTLITSATGVFVTAPDPRGLLYGAFRLLELMALGTWPEQVNVTQAPHRAIRMLNHWDNLDGSVERGYAGGSLFFRDGKVLAPSPRLVLYARLLASVGINAVVLNNVNVRGPETRLIKVPLLDRVAEVAAVLRAWGVRLYLSVNFAAPLTLGEAATADPCDPEVIRWWHERAQVLWDAIPDFGGVLVKADSEGRPGPFTYGRDQAEGANLLARAVEPFGGTVFWRCFVYNCEQDWRDRSTDRAKAAYDPFSPLAGRFLPNVILQIKNGPMDFQPREPVSPLLGAMEATRQVVEFQITQEYTGQQRHLCYLPEQWRTVLQFDTGGRHGRISSVVDGFTAVANVGDDANWTGHDLAQANWYGFGRLAWNPDLEVADLARDWAMLTFGADTTTVNTVTHLLLGSWETYELYTAPLGVGWMVNPSHHYGPNPDGYEYDRWGTYHFADRDGVGVDRTSASGTGFAAQYRPEVAARFESLADCPDELLLFFHHVPYTHRLKSGKTVIEHIYDSHFEGAEKAAALVERWATLEGRIEGELFVRVKARLEHQREHAALWRDVINTYFLRKSGMADAKGRRVYP